MSELQTKRDAQTRADLSTTAIGLFADKGFAETTMAEVAAATGVSRRTAYRHYSNKEDLLFEHPRQWLAVFYEVIASRTPEQSIKQIVSKAVLAVASLIETTKDDVLPGYGVIAATPALQSRYARTNRDWLEAYLEVIGAGITADNQREVIATSVLAGALVGGTDQSVIYWFMHQELSLVSLTEAVLESVEPLWPPFTL